MKFTKPAATYDTQINLLIERGMVISDHEYARHFLAHLNYYRLGAYWLPFETDHASHTFHEGVHFKQVIELYDFDRALRLLAMDAIERFEISIRGQWAYHLAHKYGPHAYLDASIFKSNNVHQRCMRTLQEELERSKEVFVAHYHKKYTNPEHPPVWAVVEVMSLGQLSKWVSGLSRGKDRQAIAKIYGIDEIVLTSFLHHLTIVRNICAHHGRLWNRRFGFQTKIPRKPISLHQSLNPQQPRYLYNTLVMLEYFMNTISPHHHWKHHLLTMLDKHPVVDVVAMGFPENWQNLSIWSGEQ